MATPVTYQPHVCLIHVYRIRRPLIRVDASYMSLMKPNICLIYARKGSQPLGHAVGVQFGAERVAAVTRLILFALAIIRRNQNGFI